MAEESSSDTGNIQPSIERAGGDIAFASFDELEAVDNYKALEQEATNKKEAKAEKPAKAEAKKADPKGGKKKADLDEAMEDDIDESDEADDLDDDKTVKTEKPAVKAERKVLKAKDGDQDVDLALDVKIPVTINGEPAEATLEELRNNYAGKVSWDKAHSQLGRERQKFDQNKASLTKSISEFVELSKKDGMAGMMKLAEMNGQDPVAFRNQFLSTVIPQLENYINMSEDEKKAVDREFETEHLRKQLESHKARDQEQLAISDLKSKVESLSQTHQIDPETFNKTYFELEQLQREGKFSDYITPELVAEVVLHERQTTQALAVHDELNLALEPQAKEKFVAEFMRLAQANPDLSLNDLKDVAREVYGKSKARNLSQKVRQAKGDAVKVKAEPRNPQSDPITFDDL